TFARYNRRPGGFVGAFFFGGGVPMVLPLRLARPLAFPRRRDGVQCAASEVAGEQTMPVHDWTRVEAGIFHAFHVAWIPEIQKSLNGGLLPEGYYALAEQHVGRSIADVLTLHASQAPIERPPRRLPPPPATGGTAVAEAP